MRIFIGAGIQSDQGKFSNDSKEDVSPDGRVQVVVKYLKKTEIKFLGQ